MGCTRGRRWWWGLLVAGCTGSSFSLPLSLCLSLARSCSLSLCFSDRWMSGPGAWCLVMISPSRLKALAEQSRGERWEEEERHRLPLAANNLNESPFPPLFFFFFSFPNLPLIPRAFSRGTALILARCYFNVMQIGKATSGQRLVVLTESLLWGETCLALVFNRFRYVPAYRAEETATEINILREICIWYYVTVVYWAWL